MSSRIVLLTSPGEKGTHIYLLQTELKLKMKGAILPQYILVEAVSLLGFTITSEGFLIRAWVTRKQLHHLVPPHFEW